MLCKYHQAINTATKIKYKDVFELNLQNTFMFVSYQIQEENDKMIDNED